MPNRKVLVIAIAVAAISIQPPFLIAMPTLLLIIFLLSDTTKPNKFPPGPPLLPVVGNLFTYRALMKDQVHQHLAMDALRQRYGDVVGLRLGRVNVVVVFGLSAVQAVLTNEAYDARPEGFFYKLRCRGNRLGLVFTEGPAWVEQRRFTVQQLKKQGLGRSKMEALVLDEAADIVKYLTALSSEKSSIPLHNVFDVAVVNSLWAMLAGKRFSIDDPRLAALLKSFHNIFREAEASGGLLNNMPFVRFIAPEWSGYKRALANLQLVWSFMMKTMNEHVKTRIEGKPRDLIDAYLEENRKRISQPNSTFTEEQLLALAMDLFMAGSETTSNTMGFALLYLLRHPDVVHRAQEEIDNVVGRHRLPQMHDRPRLPYLEAVIMETQRLSNTPPLGVPHRAVVETVVNGFRIPKGSTVIASLYSVQMDKAHWKNPEEFDPTRFLNEEGNLRYDEYFIPFGLGKRRCLGESLARANLFLLLASFLHKFRVAPVPELPLPVPGDDSLPGITLSPKPFYGQLTPRD